MPQDDTWEPNNISNMTPPFRNHLTRTAVAMPPSLVNTVAQAEHERRDSQLSVVSHTGDTEEKGRRVVLGLPKLSNVFSTHHDGSSGGTESQRHYPGEAVGQALGKWHGKGNTCQLRGAISSDNGEITAISKAIQDPQN